MPASLSTDTNVVRVLDGLLPGSSGASSESDFSAFHSQDKPESISGFLNQEAVDDVHFLLRLPAGIDWLRFTFWASRIPDGADPEALAAAVAAEAGPIDLAALSRGGPSRWGVLIATTIGRGNESGPFAVDTLTVPTASL